MNHRIRARLFLLALISILFTAPAFALWGTYPNDKPIECDNWPKLIVEALNSQRRVFGAGAWDAGWTFYFEGNTDDANAFLASVAREKETPVLVILDNEPGTATPDPFNKDLHVGYAWSLHMEPVREAWTTIVLREEGETDEQFKEREKKERAQLPEFSVTVLLHCIGPIDPSQLKIPLALEVKMGGRLSGLVDFHNTRRDKAKVEGKTLAESTPTTEADLATEGGISGVGGESSTQPAADDSDLFKRATTQPEEAGKGDWHLPVLRE